MHERYDRWSKLRLLHTLESAIDRLSMEMCIENKSMSEIYMRQRCSNVNALSTHWTIIIAANTLAHISSLRPYDVMFLRTARAPMRRKINEKHIPVQSKRRELVESSINTDRSVEKVAPERVCATLLRAKFAWIWFFAVLCDPNVFGRLQVRSFYTCSERHYFYVQRVATKCNDLLRQTCCCGYRKWSG